MKETATQHAAECAGAPAENAEADAVRRNAERSRFLANMSHELRTPMNAILGMINFALTKTENPTAKDCLQTAKESAGLLLRLLNDLLDSAEIEPSKGSTFRFVVQLPLAKELPPDFDKPGTVAAAPVVPLCILVVDDNPANQKLAAYILRDRGHAVEIAEDGRRAIELTEQKTYDAILMDLRMPGMGGLEATAAIRNRENDDSRVPIIAMTAHAMAEDREQCFAVGMDGYLSKPIDASELIALVEKLAAASPCLRDGVADAMMPPSAIFDPDVALEHCLNKPDLLAQMIGFFFKDVETLLPRIRTALDRRDLHEVGHLGHRLKGTIAHLGADRAKEAARRVERAGLHGGEKANLEEAVESLERECGILKATLLRRQERQREAR